MSWDEVGKDGASGGVFLSIEDGQTVRLRVLDEEPFVTRSHPINQIVDGKEIFLPVPATESDDDSFILQRTNRYPAKKRYCLRCALLDDDGEIEKVVVLIGGNQIFRPLKGMYQRHGDIRGFDIEITREGEKLDTDYHVNIPPFSTDLDVERLAEELIPPEMDWSVLFPPITPEEQKAAVERAGIDLDYDPVEEIMGEMTIEEAADVYFAFGQYGPDRCPPKGKTVGEIAVIDPGYVQWAAETVTSNDQVAAACRIVAQNLDDLPGVAKQKRLAGSTKKAAPKKAAPKKTSTKKTAPKKTSTKKTAPEGDPAEEAKASGGETRNRLMSEINDAFDSSTEYQDPMAIVNIIKKHGDGKTRIRDLTITELASLLDDVKGS